MTTRLEALKQFEKDAQDNLRNYAHECSNKIKQFVVDLREVLGGNEETVALSTDPKATGLDEHGWHVFFVHVVVPGAVDALENKYELKMYRERGVWRLWYKADMMPLHFDTPGEVSPAEVEKIATFIVQDLSSTVEKKFFKDRWARIEDRHHVHTEESTGEPVLSHAAVNAA